MTSYRGDPFKKASHGRPPASTSSLQKEIHAKHKELAQILEIGPTGFGYETLLLITAALYVGADEQRVIWLTGLKPDFVKARVERLRASGFWGSDGKLYVDPGLYVETGESGVTLLLMIFCAEGVVECHLDP